MKHLQENNAALLEAIDKCVYFGDENTHVQRKAAKRVSSNRECGGVFLRREKTLSEQSEATLRASIEQFMAENEFKKK